MSGRNISGRIFDIASLLLCLVIIWVAPAPTWVQLSTFVAKIIVSIINYFSLRLSIFASLVPPGSRRFRSGCWSFLFSGAFTYFIRRGTDLLKVPFLVASETSNSSQVPCFDILISSISTFLPPFLQFHQLVHGHLEANHITLRVYFLSLIITPQSLGLERP